MSLIKGIVIKTTPPTINDDSSKGYYVGFKYIDSTTNTTYEALSVNVGAAQWFVTNNFSKQVNGLPAASGGKITLVSGTCYNIIESTNIGTNYIEWADNCCIKGLSAFISSIVYTGTGGAIRGTDVNVSMSNIAIAPVAAGGKCWDFTNAGKTKIVFINECIISSQNTRGTISGFNIQYIQTVNFSATSNGITCSGGNYIYLVSLGFDSTNSGTFISIPSGSWIGGQVIDCTFNVSGGSTAFNLNSVSTFSSVMLLQGNLFTGAGTYTTGYNVDTYFDIEQKGNTGVKNTVATGSMAWINQTGTMSLKSASGYVKITGNTSVSSGLERVTHTSPNRLTYVGKKPINVKINVSLAAYYSTGGAFISSIAIFKNGTLITNSDNGFTIYSADEPTSTNVQTTLAQNDYIEVFIKKYVGGRTNIVISFLNVQLNETS